MNSEISMLLKMYREQNKLSQREVATYLNITAPAYHHYESGTREPNVDILKRLAQLYNLEDEILGVFKNNSNHNQFIKKYSILELKKELDSISKEYKLDYKYETKTLSLFSSQYEALVQYFQNYNEYKKNVFHDLSSAKTTNEGKLYETLTYAWLEQQGIPFEAQKCISAESCLKRNNYIADGIIADQVVFDIKMFGITNPNITKLQAKLNRLNKGRHEDYYITIGGSIDLANEVLQKLLSKTQELSDQLFSESSKMFTDYIYKIPDTGLELRAHLTKNKRIISTVSEFHPYKWARDNQYYFFHDASQFCTDEPFIIMCPFDRKTAKIFLDNSPEMAQMAFRSLCRRMFVGMPNNIAVNNYDPDCIPLVSVKAASQCVSAIIFQDVTNQFDNNGPWIFVNPNANKKLPQLISDHFRFQSCSFYEDFIYDNY